MSVIEHINKKKAPKNVRFEKLEYLEKLFK